VTRVWAARQYVCRSFCCLLLLLSIFILTDQFCHSYFRFNQVSPNGWCTSYLADDCHWIRHRRAGLRSSSDVMKLDVPPTRTMFGDRSFAVNGPRVWNSLPASICNPSLSLPVFRNRLKTRDVNFVFPEIDFRFEKIDFFSIIEFWFCASLIVPMLQSHYVLART